MLLNSSCTAIIGLEIAFANFTGTCKTKQQFRQTGISETKSNNIRSNGISHRVANLLADRSHGAKKLHVVRQIKQPSKFANGKSAIRMKRVNGTILSGNCVHGTPKESWFVGLHIIRRRDRRQVIGRELAARKLYEPRARRITGDIVQVPDRIIQRNERTLVAVRGHRRVRKSHILASPREYDPGSLLRNTKVARVVDGNPDLVPNVNEPLQDDDGMANIVRIQHPQHILEHARFGSKNLRRPHGLK
mmetsp:Transcript_7776/g.14353  ORF Transcript_7776/g.14353 Transcript_7776/m.14353 type:complete len:247 (+) Transcript_7776:752-1492(+)